MKGNKEFLNDQEASLAPERVKKALGSDFEQLLDKFLGHDGAKDLIRFLPVARRCAKAREEKGITTRDAASLLKVPQYHLKGIEGTRGINIKINTLNRYVDFLGLRNWFEDWKRHNLDVFQRMKDKG